MIEAKLKREPTVQGHDPGFATVPPTILFVTGWTVGTPHGRSRLKRGILVGAWQNLQNDLCVQRRMISLGISPVWSESSLDAQCKDPMFPHADSEGSDQTGRMPRLIWVFAGRNGHSVGAADVANEGLITTARNDIMYLSHTMRKCVFGSLQPCKTQTDLLSYRDQLESWNFGYIN